MNQIWNGVYTYSAYRGALGILRSLFSTDYQIREIPQIFSQIHRPKITIRHDVTSAPEKAVKMAEIAKECSLPSAFMFAANSSNYNIEQTETLTAINQIHQWGHEIGLFFDPVESRSDQIPHFSAIELGIGRLSLKMEKLLNFPILSVALPETLAELPEDSLFLGGKINASAPLMMKWSLSDEDTKWKKSQTIPTSNKPYEALFQVIFHTHAWK